MLALVLALALATPPDTIVGPDEAPRVVEVDEVDATVAPVFDTPMWGPINEDDEDDEDEDPPRLFDAAPSRKAPAGPAGPRLPLANALAVVATAGAVPVVVGATTAVITLVLVGRFFPGIGYGAYLVVPPPVFAAALLGAPAGAELGVALFGDARDHHWVGLGATTGAAVGLILAWSSFRAGALDFGDAVLGGAGGVFLGSAAGTGVVLVARHAGYPEAPVAVSGALLVVGSAALGLGAVFSVLGPISNDSRASLDDAVAPAVMVLGTATMAVALAIAPRAPERATE